MMKEAFDPFIDYCTSWPDYFLGKSIAVCCYQHDNDYADQLGQTISDFKMAMCVGSSNDGLLFDAWGAIMFFGLTLFGAEYY